MEQALCAGLENPVCAVWPLHGLTDTLCLLPSLLQQKRRLAPCAHSTFGKQPAKLPLKTVTRGTRKEQSPRPHALNGCQDEDPRSSRVPTRSSMISWMRFLAASTHSLAPLSVTLSLWVPDRGKLTITPPYSSAISRKTWPLRITKCRWCLGSTSM